MEDQDIFDKILDCCNEIDLETLSTTQLKSYIDFVYNLKPILEHRKNTVSTYLDLTQDPNQILLKFAEKLEYYCNNTKIMMTALFINYDDHVIGFIVIPNENLKN